MAITREPPGALHHTPRGPCAAPTAPGRSTPPNLCTHLSAVVGRNPRTPATPWPSQPVQRPSLHRRRAGVVQAHQEGGSSAESLGSGVRGGHLAPGARSRGSGRRCGPSRRPGRRSRHVGPPGTRSRTRPPSALRPVHSRSAAYGRLRSSNGWSGSCSTRHAMSGRALLREA
jgi:hypothetical protein